MEWAIRLTIIISKKNIVSYCFKFLNDTHEGTAVCYGDAQVFYCLRQIPMWKYNGWVVRRWNLSGNEWTICLVADKDSSDHPVAFSPTRVGVL